MVKSLPANAGDMGLVSGLGRSHMPWGPQQPMSRDEMMFGGFVNNLDAILAECDKDVDKRAEEQMKQRLYEQKQADMMIAQNVDAARQNAQIDLSQHENDFVVESEQDLRSYV